MITVGLMTAQTKTEKTNTKKERRVEMFGSVYDSFTKARLKAHLTLMTAPDSTVVDTTTCWTWSTSSYYQFKVPARQQDFIIKATCEGYEDTYMNYQLRHIARNNHFELPRMLMKRKQQDDIIGESSLDGVVVKGTKVKIAYRGDTLVYNASAFNLPEGSMLDGLIRQMPGAELKDNGDIYINGKKVDYLTLNGKDFFKGQNKVMLDNLPYFTVKELKVYHKSTKESERMGIDLQKKDYVMDVQLKREYNRGFMANAEGGLGTDHRYMGRLFGLYYDDHSRVSIFGNLNNVNENRKPGSDGDWKPANMPVGLRATKQAGLSIETEDKDKRYEEEFETSVEWNDADQHTRTSTETFAADGNIFGGSASMSRQKDFRFQAHNRLALNKPINISLDMRLNYTNGRRNTFQQDSTYRERLINETQNAGLNKYRTLTMNGGLFWHKKFDWGDYLFFAVNGGITRQKPSESFSRNQTRYFSTGDSDLREYYHDTHQDQNNWQLQGSYILQMLNNWYIYTTLQYDQKHEDLWNMNYRLDWLGGLNGNAQHDLGWLPSMRETLLTAFDDGNSDTQHKTERKYSAELQLMKTTESSFFSVELPIEYVRERMSFNDYSEIDTLAHRHYVNVNPSISFYRWKIKNGLRHIDYNLRINRPDFGSLMPGDETTNPLVMNISNPDLKPHIDHNFGIGFTFRNDSIKRYIDLSANATLVQQAWGTRTLYDPTSGRYTYTVDNINGNWLSSLTASYQRPLDRKKHLTFTNQAHIDYQHSVDFPIEYAASSSAASLSLSKSTVHNWTFSDHLKLEYQLGDLTASISGTVKHRLADSNRQDFQRIRAWDYDYGTALTYTIPWMKVTLATDLRMYSRRGYYSDMMNDDHLVWNAQLSRSLLKDKLTLKLTAFDLLHQLSDTQYSVNAQGRTETWQNCINRYLMFTVAYKFTRKPKSE